jgi:hypothetical protein
MHPILRVASVVFSLGLARGAQAQGEVSGRVLAADSGRAPVQGAEASIAKLGRTALSDSSGRFRLKDVPPGEHVLVVRAIGFESESSLVFIDREEVVSSQILLKRGSSVTLPERVVTAAGERVPAKLAEFMERRKAGTGHFIDRTQLARAEGGLRQTGDLISTVPGVTVKRGSNKVWIASGRAVGVRCAFCSLSPSQLNPADLAAGARPACFMDVYLDGAMIYDSRHPENGLFDANSIQPEHIAAIEVYTSASQIPAKYNRTAAGCGVLLIWTK